MFKRPKRRVVIDTNIISGGIGDLERPQLDAVITADLSKEHIYTKEVDDELSDAEDHYAKHRHNPLFIFNIRMYRLIKRPHMVDNKINHECEPDNPGRGKDKKILNAAIKVKADTVVTLDKRFRKNADGFKGIRFLKPDEYLRGRKVQ